jgi:outer membrane protein assembly factor BamB
MKSSTTPTVPPTGHRLWLPIGVGLLALGLLAWVHLQPDLERNLKAWATGAILILSLSLFLAWFLFLSRLPTRLRLGTFAFLLLAALLSPSILRIDGSVSGTGLPRIAWRRTPPPTPPTTSPSSPATLGSVPPAPSPGRIPDFPQFLGPDRSGIVPNPGLATDWNVQPPRLLWRVPVGLGWSSFSIAHGLAFTLEQQEDQERLVARDALTGVERWIHSNQTRFSEWQGGDGPRSTPTVVSNHLYSYGGTGILDCLDPRTGSPVWTRSILKELAQPNLTWGVSASPLVSSNLVIVSTGAGSGPTLLALDRFTGQTRWQAGTDQASYSSPILSQVGQHPVIASLNAASFTLHDPADGRILLDHPWPDARYPKAAQPVAVGENRFFLSSGYGRGCQLIQVHSSSNQPFPFQAVVLWKNLVMKNQFNSVAVRDGHLFGLDDGLLACVDLSSGKRVWKDGRYGSGQSLLVNDLILVQAEPGFIALAAANPSGFTEFARLPALDSKTWNHPVLSGRHLFVRNDREAACFELPIRP